MSRPAPGHPNAPTFPQPWNLIEPMVLPHDLPTIQYGKARRAGPIPTGRAPTPPEYSTPPILGEDVNGDLEEDNFEMTEDRDFYEPNLVTLPGSLPRPPRQSYPEGLMADLQDGANMLAGPHHSLSTSQNSSSQQNTNAEQWAQPI